MMKNWLVVLVGFAGLIGTAEGALGPVIDGQVYDDVQGISWLQDANLFKTLCDAEGDIANPENPILVSYNEISPVRNTATACDQNGVVNWADAEKFIAALNANNYLGINTWRQPAVLQPDATCETLYAAANLPSYPEQRGGFNCRAVGSEFGHLYNIAPPDGLGNPNNAGTGSTGGTVGTGCYPNCWENDGPFINTGWYWYWLGAEYAPDPAYAWRFNRNGLQDIIEQASGVGHVWAVHPGRQAAKSQVVCLDGDTVTGIKDMTLVTDEYGSKIIDVDFRYATGYEVYGSGLDTFPFVGANSEEDVFATMTQINNVLGANNPVPGSAGQPGQNSYFIGVEKESDAGITRIAAAGSENLAGFWDPCTMANDCIAGAAVLNPEVRFTYADLKLASGGSCTGSPPADPGPGYTIVPCITGTWYDPERDGEGYDIEIIGSSLDPQMLVYFYTYDETGEQMWLVGSGPVDGDTAVVPVQVTSGPVYGDGYNKDDVVRENWGTLTFMFDTKDAGSVVRASTMGFGTTTKDIFRLAYVTGLTCP